jgi:hypothetical protein
MWKIGRAGRVRSIGQHLKCSRAPWSHPLAVSCLWLLASLAQAQGQAAPAFRSPFHPDECVPAILEAQRQLGMNPGAGRWQRILAQGFLCMGLKDDPVALDRAAAIFRAVLAKAPEDIPAQVGLADALRRRAPLSPEALAELNRAQQLVEHRAEPVPPRLGRYVAENLVALDRRRSEFLNPGGAAGATARIGVELSARGHIEIDLERGPRGFPTARLRVAVLLREEGARPRALVWLAELRRQQGRYRDARTLLRWVRAQPCRAAPPGDVDCNFAREQDMKLAEQCADWDQITGGPVISPCVQPATAAQAAEGGRLW